VPRSAFFNGYTLRRLGSWWSPAHRRGFSTVTGGFVAYAHQVALGVLGQTGWLDRMRLGLVDQDSQLYLSHYDDAAGEEK